jgi:hypothetical protein
MLAEAVPNSTFVGVDYHDDSIRLVAAAAIEPYAEDTLEANLDNNPIAAVFYIRSSALCVPHSVLEGGAALGAQPGPTRLTGAFRDTSFARADIAIATATTW